MRRPRYTTRKIVAAGKADEPNRERLTLECGHELIQAPRARRRKRAYCPECNEDAS